MNNSVPVQEVKCWFCKEIVEYYFENEEPSTIKDHIHLFCKNTSKGSVEHICLECAQVNMPQDLLASLTGETNGK